MRLLKRFTKVAGIVVLGFGVLLAGIVAGLLLFPFETLLPSALTRLTTETGIQLQIESAKIRLANGIELTKVELAPPPGFSLAPLRVRRLVITYSLASLLTERTLIIKQILIDSPNFGLESLGTEQNGLSVLLEMLGLNPAEPKPEESQPSNAGIKIKINNLTISNASIILEQPGSRIELTGLTLVGSASVDTKTKQGFLDVKLVRLGDLNVSQNEMFAEIELPWSLHLVSNDLRSFSLNAYLPTSVNLVKGNFGEVSGFGVQTELSVSAHLNDQFKPTEIRLNNLAVVANGLNLWLTAKVQAGSAWKIESFDGFGLLNLQELLAGLGLWGIAEELEGNIQIQGKGSGLAVGNKAALPDSAKLCLAATGVRFAKNDLKVSNANTQVCLSVHRTQINLSADGFVHRAIRKTSGVEQLRFYTAAQTMLEENLKPIESSIQFGLLARSVFNGNKRIKNAQIGARVVADTKLGHLELTGLRFNIGRLLSAKAEADVDRFGEHGSLGLQLKIPNLKLLAQFLAGFAPKVSEFAIAGKLDGSIEAKWRLTPDRFRRLLPQKVCVQLAQNGAFPESACKKAGTLRLRRFPGTIKLHGTISGLALANKASGLVIQNGDVRIDGILRGKRAQTEVRVGVEKAVFNEWQVANLTTEFNAEVTTRKLNARVGLALTDLTGTNLSLTNLKVGLESAVLLENFKPNLQGSKAQLSLDIKKVRLIQKAVLKQAVTKTKLRKRIRKVSGVHAQVAVKLSQAKLAEFDGSVQVGKVDDSQTKVEGVTVNVSARTVLDNQLNPHEISAKVNAGIKNLARQGLPFDLRNNTLNLRLSSPNALREVELQTARLEVPSIGLQVRLSGKVNPLVLSLAPFEISPEPNGDLSLAVSISAKQGLKIENREISGVLGIDGTLELAGSKALVSGRLYAHDFSARIKSSKGKRSSMLAINGLELDIPFKQRLIVRPTVRLEQLDTSVLRGTALLYDQLRDYAPQKRNFVLQGLLYEQYEGSTLVRRLKFDLLEMDLRYAANAFAIDRLHLRALGGDAIGRLRVELNPEAVARPKLTVQLQVSGMNLAYLEGSTKPPSKETEVSALMRLDLDLLRRSLSGRVDITEISLKQLDELLVFIDPQGTDPKIQKNRQTLRLARIVKPRVERVAIWIEHENLNMDINISSLPGVEQVLQSVLDNLKLRRYSIAPILKRYLPEPNRRQEAQEHKETAKADVATD